MNKIKQRLMKQNMKRERKICSIRENRANLHGENIKIKVSNGYLQSLIYRDNTAWEGPVLFDIHGGGFMFNSCYDDDDLCQYLHNKLGITVVSCNYRRSPKYPYPAGLNDIYETIRYMIRNKEYPIDKNKIIILGHSAGGNLAAAVTLLAKEKKEFLPYLQILNYPYLDVYRDSKSRPRIRKSISPDLMDTFAHFYAKDKDKRKNPFVSPVCASDQMLQELPDTYILTCGCDNLNIGAIDYSNRLKKNGVCVTNKDYAEAIHGFIENTFNYSNIPFQVKLTINKKQKNMAYEAVDSWCDWINEKLGIIR